jgi:hypothetical protein
MHACDNSRMSVREERGFGRSLRAELERDRNTLRRRRLELVTAVLRERAAFGRELGALSPPRRTRTAGKP